MTEGVWFILWKYFNTLSTWNTGGGEGVCEVLSYNIIMTETEWCFSGDTSK